MGAVRPSWGLPESPTAAWTTGDPSQRDEIRDVHIHAAALRIVLPVGVAGAGRHDAQGGGGRRRRRRRRLPTTVRTTAHGLLLEQSWPVHHHHTGGRRLSE